MPERQTNNLEVKIISAKAMIEFGCAVVPVRPDQAPDIHKAIKDPDKIERYFRAHPTYNYVAATGMRSGVFVVTVKGARGITNFAKMLEANRRLPAMMIVSRGENTDFYFLTSDAGVPNCEIAKGIEVRGDGSFVPGPGSKGSDGKINTIVFDYCHRELNIHSAPQWLLKEINSAEIKRLAQLSDIEYEGERDKAAMRLRCRVSVLDKLVQRARNPGTEDGSKDRSPSLREPKPWPDAVDGSVLLNELTAAISRYVVVGKDIARAIALWIVHTYALAAFNITPRLAIKSPLPQCGKSTLLDVLSCLVCRPLATVNITAAALFRIVETANPTLLIDEADTFLVKNDELRAILNSGHRRGSACVIRIEGENLEPRQFSTYAAAAIASIGPLPHTLEDRSNSRQFKTPASR